MSCIEFMLFFHFISFSFIYCGLFENVMDSCYFGYWVGIPNLSFKKCLEYFFCCSMLSIYIHIFFVAFFCFKKRNHKLELYILLLLMRAEYFLLKKFEFF